jgi:hypothetical protein
VTADLAAWLHARLDEIEQVARAAISASGHWRWEHGMGDMCNEPECPYGELMEKPGPGETHDGVKLMEVHGYDVKQAWQGAAHIAMHDPAAVLRDVEAKRRLLEEVFQYEAKIDGEWSCCHSAGNIAAGLCPNTPVDEITALRILAQPFADRDDFREEWKL